MVGIGTLLAAIGLAYLFLRLFRRRTSLPRWLLVSVVAAGPLSVVALIAGWITTEVGRQPWIVYDVMRVDAAVTGASDIPIGYGTLSVVYVVLGVIVFVILRRLARVPLPPDAAAGSSSGAAASGALAIEEGLDGLRARRVHAGRDDRVHGAGGGGLRGRAVDAARGRAVGVRAAAA
jgi:cytochrome d ubiquinol oxidase subunit I